MYFVLACASIFVYGIIQASKKKPKSVDVQNPNKQEEANSEIKEIRFQNRFYDVTKWVKRHPGGKVIEFYVNNTEDATEAIGQFHHRSAFKVRKLLEALPSREVPSNFVEPSPKYRNLSGDFEKMYLDLQKEGFFKPSSWHVVWRIAEILALMALGYIVVTSADTYYGLVMGGAIFGLFQMRCSYLVHETGHNSITGSPKLDKFMQAVVSGLGTGQSASWWRSQHNRHHAMPQRLHHDVDLDTLPGLAYNVKVFDKTRHDVDILLRNQKKIYVPVISTVGILGWKLVIHPRHMWRKKEYLEIVTTMLHYVMIYQYIGFIPYLVMTACFSSGLLLNFGLSHSHLPVTEEPRHWVEYCLLHTMNIEPSWWCDWWMGYLNYQIEHHLFPTIPHFRHRKIRTRVMALAKKHGLPYVCTSYWGAVTKFFDNLGHVAEELSQLRKLQQ